MSEFFLYEKFDNYQYVREEDLKKIQNYICGNLISWSPNRRYWYEEYNICTKLFSFIDGEKKEVFNQLLENEKLYAVIN